MSFSEMRCSRWACELQEAQGLCLPAGNEGRLTSGTGRQVRRDRIPLAYADVAAVTHYTEDLPFDAATLNFVVLQ